jgi:hypothetical protein
MFDIKYVVRFSLQIGLCSKSFSLQKYLTSYEYAQERM